MIPQSAPQTALNERQELFCREYVRRPVGKWAAAAAGYESASTASQASRLLARDDIQARIAELRAEVARQQCREADAILANLQSIYELALIDHQYGTAVRAVTLQARIAGVLPGPGTRDDAIRDASEAVVDEMQDVRENLDVKESQEAPATAPETAPMSTDDNQCEQSRELPPPPQPATNAPGPAPMQTDVNRCKPSAANPVPQTALVTRWPSGRKRRTLSGRRK